MPAIEPREEDLDNSQLGVVVDESAEPWVTSLKGTMNELAVAVEILEMMNGLRASGRLPAVSLSVADPDDRLRQYYTFPWDHGLAKIPADFIDTCLWNPLVYSLRERIAKLVLDVGELNQFIRDRYAPGAPDVN